MSIGYLILAGIVCIIGLLVICFRSQMDDYDNDY